MSDESLPPGWALAKFEDILIDPKADLVDGPFGSNLKSSEYVESGVPVLKIQNIKADRFVRKHFSYVTEVKAEELSRHSFVPGDLMITKLGDPLGLCCEVPSDFPAGVFVADLMRLRLRTEKVSKRFLLLVINSQVVQSQFKQITKGTTRPRVNLTIVRSLEIPLPPLAEQKRIVAKIEELFSELEAGEESLRVARRQLGVYRQSLLQQAFEGKLTARWRTQNPDQPEWRDVPLASVIEFTSGFTFKSEEYIEAGVPVVRISDISEEGVSLANTVKISARPEFEKFRLQKGDILIAMSGATTGKFGELKSDEKCYLNQRVGCFRTKDKVRFSQRFLHHLLHGLKRKIEKDAYGGAQPNISGKQISAYSVPSPSLPEQQEIVRVLDEQFEGIERNEREIDGALRSSEALRQAILQKAFTGRLVPQDPSDEPAATLLARLRAESASTPARPKRRTQTSSQ